MGARLPNLDLSAGFSAMSRGADIKAHSNDPISEALLRTGSAVGGALARNKQQAHDDYWKSLTRQDTLAERQQDNDRAYLPMLLQQEREADDQVALYSSSTDPMAQSLLASAQERKQRYGGAAQALLSRHLPMSGGAQGSTSTATSAAPAREMTRDQFAASYTNGACTGWG